MKTIPLVLTGLLGISSISPCVAENTVQPGSPARERNSTAVPPAVVSGPAGSTPISSTSAKSTAGIGNSPIYEIPATPASRNVAQVKQAAPPSPAPVRLPADNEVNAEGTEKDAAGDKNKDKGKAAAAPAIQKETIFKEMVVTGEVERDSHYTSPSTRITRTQIELQNAQTTEEVLKYQPSLQIRQRYVGDPNGVLGIRGADMFSTARNMVYADGLPLHNFLQASFNGAPRWSMVGPNEIDAVDVVYGPFSAEYSGNSIGGVINIKTRMPRKQEFYVESSLFIQPYKLYGPDKGTFIGDRQFVSYGNRFKDVLSVYLAYNRLEAQGHPMSYFIDNTGLGTLPSSGSNPTAVTGGIRTPDTRGTPSIIYGDTGPEKVNTHLFKGKLGYDITSELQAIFTVAYEDRTRNQNHPRNYLLNGAGQPFYGGPTNTPLPNAVFDGSTFDVLNRGFGFSSDKRETLNLGLQLRGALTPNWNIDSTISHFDVLKDVRATAFFNPADPNGNGAGQLQDFKKFSWLNYDLKVSTPTLFGNEKISLLAGYHFDLYTLSFRQYSLLDYATMTRGTLQPGRNNDGQTSTHAVFAQSAYRFLPNWDVTVGARQEWWSAMNGVVGGTQMQNGVPISISTAVPDRAVSALSPKVSLGYEPGPWKIRYSFGRAHRFPVIAELFQSLSSPTQIVAANANLRPENGVHHNFMVEYGLPKGYIRVNAFRDDIKDAIQQVLSASGVLTQSSFQNIDQTSTTGVELIFDQRRIFGSKFDFMFNGTWMNAKVDKGPLIRFTETTGAQADFNLTGKQRIRLPHWRANFFATYHATEAWDISFSGRYTSDSFNDLDNRDHVNNVFGAQSDFFFMDFKTSYRFKLQNGLKSRVSFGITNINNDKAFVFHPYPQRTYLVEAAFSY
jgi:iron complex outermembrane receptor protein